MMPVAFRDNGIELPKEFHIAKKNLGEHSRSLLLLAVRTRLELATPCVTGMYSNQLNYPTKKLLLSYKMSGEDEARTRDPMRDRHVF